MLNNDVLNDAECTHVSFLKLVDVVFAVDQLPISGVPLVSNQIYKNGCICATAADSPRANCQSVFDHCRTESHHLIWFYILLYIWQSRFWLLMVNTSANTHRAAAQRSVLRWQAAPSQPHCRLHSCPASARKETCTSPLLTSSSKLPNWKKIRVTRVWIIKCLNSQSWQNAC